MTANETSSVDRLGEELGLLPGRISRYFFMLATLDAQATRLKCDLQHSRVQLLEYANVDEVQQQHSAVSLTDELRILRQLHLAQRQLLSDKLFVDKKATEWLTRAKNVVNRYSQESRRRFHSRLHSPTLDAHHTSLPNRSMAADPSVEGRQRTRISSGIDEQEAFDPYDLKSSEPGSIVAGGAPKRRRISNGGDFIAPGRPPHRRSDLSGVSNRKPAGPYSRTSSGEIGRPPKTKFKYAATLPPGGFTIKLGSQQKGRPRKMTAKGGPQADGASLPGELYETEEYFCPICGKSDYEDPAMVACDTCDKWYHCVCVGFVDVADAESSKNFYCSDCLPDHKETSTNNLVPDPDESDQSF